MATSPFGWLGLPAEQKSVGWGNYLESLRGSVNASWKDAVTAYSALKATRKALGLPFMDTPGGEGYLPDPDAWTPSLEQDILDTQLMVKIFDGAVGDVLAGKRKLVWNESFQNFGVEARPSDTVRLVVTQGGQPALLDIKENTEFHASGTVGAPPVLIAFAGVAIAAAAVIQTVAVAYAVKQICDSIVVISQQKTQQSLAKVAYKNAELVEQGKLTPQQAQSQTTALYAGAQGLQREQNEVQKNDAAKHKQLMDTLMTLGYVGIGIAAIVTFGKFIPSGRGLLENPVYGWISEMFVDGTWSSNSLVFQTKKEAESYGRDLFSRWTLPTDKRVRRVRKEPNYKWTDLGLQPIETP